MTLLRVDASIRPVGSVSRALTETVEQAWLAEHPAGAVIRRDLVADPIPFGAWPDAAAATSTPPDQHTPAQLEALRLAATLADEVLAADSLVVGAPLYNYGVSQHVKGWLDMLLIDPRFAPAERPLEGKPVALAIARGGGYGEGTPRHGWDHATPWLTRIFADVWGADVRVVAAELTLADVVPAMAELRGIADESRRDATKLAEETGRAFASMTVAA